MENLGDTITAGLDSRSYIRAGSVMGVTLWRDGFHFVFGQDSSIKTANEMFRDKSLQSSSREVTPSLNQVKLKRKKWRPGASNTA